MVTTRKQAVEIAGKVRAGLETIYAGRLRGVYLFGSAVRGQLNEDSDIDIAIVIDRINSSFEEHERTSELGTDVSLEAGILVNFLFIPESDLAEGRYAIYRAVRREGIPV